VQHVTIEDSFAKIRELSDEHIRICSGSIF